MKSQPQNPEFRNNPENFPPCFYKHKLSLNKRSDELMICTPYISLSIIQEKLQMKTEYM